MANKRHNPLPNVPGPKNTRGVSPGPLPPDTLPGWHGLPGPAQSRDRAGGIRKSKTRAKSEGV